MWAKSSLPTIFGQFFVNFGIKRNTGQFKVQTKKNSISDIEIKFTIYIKYKNDIRKHNNFGGYVHYFFQKFIAAGERCPEGYSRLENTQIVVPDSWLSNFLLEKKRAKTGEKVKSMLESFFEPQDMAPESALKMQRKYPNIMEAVKCKYSTV